MSKVRRTAARPRRVMSCHDFKNDSYSYVIPGSISAVAAGCVIITCALFSELRRLRYIELVLYVSLSDFFLSVAMALGPTREGTTACVYQGLASNYFVVTSFFWVTVINYQVWLVVFKGEVLKDLTWMHLTGWVFPIFTTFLVYTTSKYGITVDDDEESRGWCFVAETSTSPAWADLFWVLVSFYIWLWLSIVINVAMLAFTINRIQRMEIVSKQMWQTIGKLALYPMTLIFCWFSASMFDINEYATSYRSSFFDCLSGVATVTAGLQGLLFAVIFFTMNSIVREKWIGVMVAYGLLRVEVLERHRKARIMVRETFEATVSTVDRPYSITDEEDYIEGDGSISQAFFSMSLSWITAGPEAQSSDNNFFPSDLRPVGNPLTVARSAISSGGSILHSPGVRDGAVRSSPAKALELPAACTSEVTSDRI